MIGRGTSCKNQANQPKGIKLFGITLQQDIDEFARDLLDLEAITKRVIKTVRIYLSLHRA